jgi:RNA polymerase sigma factor (TIGR02999 family)
MNESLDTLIQQWREGNAEAGERAIQAAYGELRKLAAYHFRHENPGHTLQPTALVHEAVLKISGGAPVQWQNRAHFFAVMARQMRLILVDHARRRRALKRNDAQIEIAIGAGGAGSRSPQPESILTVHRILDDLEQLDERAARVTELRVFGGLKDAEIALALEISLATVKRDWSFARAWLLSRLEQ